jgi:hypothetical protein
VVVGGDFDAEEGVVVVRSGRGKHGWVRV